jgi:hypothetical protein
MHQCHESWRLTAQSAVAARLLLRAATVAVLAGCTQRDRTAPTASGGEFVEIGQSCVVCDIRLDTIGSLTDPVVSWMTWVGHRYRAGSRELVLTPTSDRSRLALVPADLKQLPRILGGPGGGPGEFSGIRAAAGFRNDSLMILEATRIWIVGDDSLRGRAVQLPTGVQAFSLSWHDSSLILLNSYVPGSPPLVAIDADGQVVWSVDSLSTGTSRDTDDPDTRRYMVLSAPNGDVVTVPAKYRFGLDRFGPDGVALQQASINPSWFASWSEADADRETAEMGRHRPLAFVLDAQIDGRGRLWLMGRIPDAEWQKAVDGDSVDWDRWLDTVIEVYDMADGTRLGAVRLDGLFYGFAGDGLAYSRTDDPDGLPVVTFFTVKYTER